MTATGAMAASHCREQQRINGPLLPCFQGRTPTATACPTPTKTAWWPRLAWPNPQMILILTNSPPMKSGVAPTPVRRTRRRRYHRPLRHRHGQKPFDPADDRAPQEWRTLSRTSEHRPVTNSPGPSLFAATKAPGYRIWRETQRRAIFCAGRCFDGSSSSWIRPPLGVKQYYQVQALGASSAVSA